MSSSSRDSQPITLLFGRLLTSDSVYQISLFFLLGVLLLSLTVTKSGTTVGLHYDLFLRLSTVFVTLFELSRVGAALLYYNAPISSPINDGWPGRYEPSVTFVIP